MSEGLGAFLGSFVGLLAILVGALLNASLVRRRDNRLQSRERQALAVALRGELLLMRERVAWRWKTFHEADERRKKVSPRWNWTIQDRDIYGANRGRLSLLNAEMAEEVVDTYGRMEDYALALKLANKEYARSSWVAGLLSEIFDKCTQTANKLARTEGLQLPPVETTIDQVARSVFARDLKRAVPAE